MAQLREHETTRPVMTHPNLRGMQLDLQSRVVPHWSTGLNKTRADRTRPPKHYPSDGLNVPAGRPQANSRFLTDCYHVLAALLPAWPGNLAKPCAFPRPQIFLLPLRRTMRPLRTLLHRSKHYRKFNDLGRRNRPA